MSTESVRRGFWIRLIALAIVASSAVACIIGPKPDEPSSDDTIADGGTSGDDSSFQFGDSAVADTSPIPAPPDGATDAGTNSGAGCDDGGCDAEECDADGAIDGEAGCTAPDASDASDASDATDASDASDVDATDDADAPGDAQEGG